MVGTSVTRGFQMEILELKKLLPICRTGRSPIDSQGIRRLHIAKFFGIVLVFVFFSVNFSKAAIKVNIKSTYKQKPNKMFYILLWTPHSYIFKFYFHKREDMMNSKCSATNCHFTKKRDFFGGDIRLFDAVIFDGQDLKNYKKSNLPKQRSDHQNYIFLNRESSDNHPIWNPIFDNFFNWTATYKLNSDVVLPYFSIRNKANKEIGPKSDMTWIQPMSEVNNTFKSMLQKKSKAVAWFVSHCRTRSRREDYTKALKKALKIRNLSLDIFGHCGQKKCPKSQKCLDLLKNEYYFYLSFENSFAEDYVTEKVITPLLAGAVPVVYGGANYSRFLPPSSYIDASKYTPRELAELIAQLIANPAEYEKLFRWRNHYSYRELYTSDEVCRLCEAFNAREKTGNRKVYKNFRGWWNGNYVEWLTKLLYLKRSSAEIESAVSDYS